VKINCFVIFTTAMNWDDAKSQMYVMCVGERDGSWMERETGRGRAVEKTELMR